MSGVIYWLDMAGVIVFALSGVILACRSRMDPFGMLVLAAVTGIGGGTLRDLVLGVRPVFWVTDPTYLWVILATVGVSLVGFHYIHRLSRGFFTHRGCLRPGTVYRDRYPQGAAAGHVGGGSGTHGHDDRCGGRHDS